jgi:hypothetical protein
VDTDLQRMQEPGCGTLVWRRSTMVRTRGWFKFPLLACVTIGDGRRVSRTPNCRSRPWTQLPSNGTFTKLRMDGGSSVRPGTARRQFPQGNASFLSAFGHLRTIR